MNDSLESFLAMGGYAEFVWPAYLLTLAVLAGNVIAPMLRRRQLRARVVRQAKLEERET